MNVLIVGGGPSGSTCAWRLRQLNLRTLVIDRKNFPRDKPCAGWITPQVVRALRLDTQAYSQQHTCQPITGFRCGVIGGKSIELDYHEPVSFGIRRFEFDRYLLERSGSETRLNEAAEKIERRHLEAIVSASGKIQPKKSVNSSAETMGKVVRLYVEQGDMVKSGQPLLEIEARNLETAVQQRQASLDTAKSTLEQTKAQVNTSRVALRQAEETLVRQEQQYKAGLLSRQDYERAQNDVETQRTNNQVSQQSVLVQEQRIRRVGGNEQIAVNVRMIAATNRDLRRRVEEGAFREDLYYRLNVVSIAVPPLRERGGDVHLLAQHFVDQYARAAKKPMRGLALETLDLLSAHHWPGNVRELENAIARAVALSSSELLMPDGMSLPLRTDNRPLALPRTGVARHSRGPRIGLPRLDEVQ
jgi:hypothetical protein